MWTPETLWIERGEESSALARRVVRRLPDIPVRIVDDLKTAEPDSFAEGKRRLVLQRHRGPFMEYCPAGTTGMVCCSYLIVSFASNCPFDCTYCFLQDYVANNPAVKAFTNVGDGLAEVDAALRRHPERTFRVGTGELADSLALDPLTELSAELVPFFAERANAVLELKTKSTCVDTLLRLDPKDRVVVSWSVNAAQIIAGEDRGAPALAERLDAAVRVQSRGYRVGFHFDPLIAHEGWEEGYRAVIDEIFSHIDGRRVAWVSLGSLRMTAPLKAAIRSRRDRGDVLTGELVPCPDGKERLWRGLRVKMYRRISEWLRQADSRVPVYMCMEPPAVWERVFGRAPADRELGERLVVH